MFPLAIEVEGTDVVVRRSRQMYVVRGLLGVFLLPILFGLLLVLVAVGFTDGTGSEDTWTGIWIALSSFGVLWGLGLLVLSGWLSRRNEVRFDRARALVLHKGASHPFEGLAVGVRGRPGLGGWNILELHRQGVPVVVVDDRIAGPHADDLARHAEYLGRLLGSAPVAVAPGAAYGAQGQKLFDDKTAAMLCYLPLQGIHLVASLYYVSSARSRPFVHFAARQSLLQTGVTMLALLVCGVGFGVPLALVSAGSRELPVMAIVFIALLSISLLLIAIANVVGHLVACVRAYRGVTWIMPWLRWIVRRWNVPTGGPL